MKLTPRDINALNETLRLMVAALYKGRVLVHLESGTILFIELA
jgi:hypothetical protein